MKYNKLRILSPVHIGCGETYSGLNFIIDKNKLHNLDIDVIYKSLRSNNQQAFILWVGKNTNEINKLENAISQLKKKNKYDEIRAIKRECNSKRREFTLKSFLQSRKINYGEMLEQAAYSLPIQGGIYNDTEIHPFLKQMNQPYIPGSEVKGAIRTAVIYCALMDNRRLWKWLLEQINKFGLNEENRNDLKKVANKKKPDKATKKGLESKMSAIEAELQHKVFYGKESDAKYDVFKFLNIGDSPLLDAEKVLAVSYIKSFGMSNEFTIAYEFLKPGEEVSLNGLEVEDKRSRERKLEHMGVSKDQENIVSDRNNLFRFCHRFSTDLLTEEIAYYKKHKKGKIVSHLETIASANQPDTPVLRIGKDEGYNSLTVGMAVKAKSRHLYENVLIHATKNKSYDSSHGGPLPKSRKIVHWDNSEVTAGWVQLIPESKQVINEKKDSENSVVKSPGAKLVDLSAFADKFNKKWKRS